MLSDVMEDYLMAIYEFQRDTRERVRRSLHWNVTVITNDTGRSGSPPIGGEFSGCRVYDG